MTIPLRRRGGRLARAAQAAPCCDWKRRAIELAARLNSVTQETVPYTLDRDMKAGETIMIRVPRLFFPQDFPAK